MGPAYLILVGVALLLGLPLLALVLWTGAWLRRSGRARAHGPFVGVALAGALSYLSFFGAVAALIAIVAKEQRHPDYFESHPLIPLVMIGLGLLALFMAFLCALFGAWTIWRIVEAPSQSGTPPA